MKNYSSGGRSHYNAFAEKYKKTLKDRRKPPTAKDAALKMAKVDAPKAKSGVSKVIR